MGLTRKTIITMVLIMLVSVSSIVFTLWIYISSQFNKTELVDAEKDLEMFSGIISREIDAVDSFCRDYAYWDDTYKFMKNPSAQYIRSNFNSAYMKTQNIQMVCIVNLKGEILYSIFYDGNRDSYREVSLRDFHRNDSVLHSMIISASKGITMERGIAISSMGLLAVAANPVRDDFISAEPRGKIIMGRMINNNLQSRICSLLKVVGTVYQIDEITELHPESTRLNEMISSGKDTIFSEHGNYILSRKILNGINGRPAAMIALSYPRDIQVIGLNTVSVSALIIMAFGIVIIIIISYFLRRDVLIPIEGLTERAVLIGKTGDFESRLPIRTDDEIATLAWTFNELLDRLSELNYSLEKRVEERTSELVTANRELMLMQQVFDHSLEGIVITDCDANILQVNPAFTSITGYAPEEVFGKNPRLLKSEHHDERFYDDMWKSLIETGYWESEIWNRHKDGKAYPEWLSIGSIRDAKGEITHYVGLFHDISDIKRQEEFIRHQAFHDSLTGLPNRPLLFNRVERAIAHANRERTKFGIIYLDLDNFKNINDSLGHAVGDILLREASGRLRRMARSVDTVARIGGDEFIVLVEDMIDEKPAAFLAQRIIDSFKKSFIIKTHDLHVGTSIGIAIYPDDGDDTEVLIRNADTAMYRAKEKGRENFTMFTTSLNERVANRLRLENKLRRAIEETEFEVFYQPKMEIKTGTIAGMEGLVRWHHDGSIVSPDDFIPLAEETGLIVELDKIVMDMAFREMSGLIRSGLFSLKLSLNCSAKALQLISLPDIILDAMVKHDFKPEWFELEITETSLMKNSEMSMNILYHLLEIGVSVALDDFGTGYSSLAQLKNLPITSIKIDKSFIWEMEKSRNDAHITESIIAMSKKVGVEVVAEGVEKREQLLMLEKAGCDLAQGYLISRPLPFDDFQRYLLTFH